MDHTLEAQVIDSHHLRLKKPITIGPGSMTKITIEDPAQAIVDDPEWYLLSSQGLSNIYSKDEPDYPLNRVKEPNPEFRP
jgi:hypothetical protein